MNRQFDQLTIGKTAFALLFACCLAVLAGCPSTSGTSTSNTPATSSMNTPGMQGDVYGGRQPIAGSTVVAYAMATTSGNAPEQIGSATTDSSGNFTMTFSPTPVNGQIVYLEATGGNAGSGTNSAIALMTVAGPYCSGTGCAFPASVNIDELSTVVSAAAMRLYIDLTPCSNITGNTQPASSICVGLSGDSQVSPLFAQSVAAQVDLATGQASGFLTSQASSSPIHLTLEKADTLADILAACVNSSGPTSSACTGLFSATLNNAGDTLTAAYDIATSPVINAKGATLFSLLPASPVYTPVVTAAPANWTIAGNVYSYAANYGTGTTNGSVSAWQVATQGAVSLVPITGGAGACNDSTDPKNCFSAGQGPDSLVITQGGQFVYAANLNSSNISAWAVDPATGVLVPVTSGAVSCGTGLPSNCFADDSPAWMAVNASGTYLYVTNFNSNTVSVFSINSSSGALIPVSGSPFAAGPGPDIISLDSAGPFAYVANANGDSVSAYTIDATTGALTPVITGGAGACNNVAPQIDPDNCFAAGLLSESLTVDPSGPYLYVANTNCASFPCSQGNISAYTINTTTGALTDIAASSCGAGLPSNCFDTGDLPFGVAVDQNDGYLYVGTSVCSSSSSCSAGYISAYAIGAGGVLTPDTTGAGSCGLANNDPGNCFATDVTPSALVAAPQTLLAANTDDVISIYSVDSSTGTLTPMSVVSQYSADFNTQSISIDPTDRYAYVPNGSGIIDQYTLDPLTGALKLNNTISSVNATGSNVAIDPSGRYLYSPGGGGGDQVAAYSIGPADGYLNNVTGGSCGTGNTNNNCFPAGPYPEYVSVDASGKFLFASNSNCATSIKTCTAAGSVSAYTINTTTGALTDISGSSCGSGLPSNCFAAGSAPFGLMDDPAAGLLYVTNAGGNNISAYGIDSITGALTDVVGSSCGSGLPSNCFTAGTPPGITLTPSGAFSYASDYTSNSISAFSVDSSTGALTAVDGTAACGGSLPSICFEAGNTPFAGAVTPDGAYYYVTNISGNDVSAYSINSSSGALTPVTTGGAGTCSVSLDPSNCFAAGVQPQGIAVDPTDRFVYVTNRNCPSKSCVNPGSVNVYLLDSSTGALTPLSITSPFAAGSVPEDVVFGP